MIDIKSIDILKNAMCPLKDASKDNHDGTDIYLTESVIPVINFDEVKNAYVKDLKAKEVPSSNDALYANGQDLFFIEFKSGDVPRKVYDIRRKIFESLLIFTDIVNVGISYTRANMSYILVYNEEKNPLSEKEQKEMQNSQSRVDIGTHFWEKKAKKHYIRFGLERFERLYFKNVYTITQTEFEQRFVANWS
jgi:hypothetical protein